MELISFEDLVVQPSNSYFSLEKELHEVKSQLSLMEQRLKYFEEGKLTLEERIHALEVKYEELDDNRGKDNVKIHKDIKCINNDMKYVRNDMKCIKNRVDCLEYNESEREENEISLEERLKYLEDDTQIITIENQQFLDTNCSDINFVHSSPGDTCILFDEVRIVNFGKNFDKVINKLKNIKTIGITFRFPVSGNCLSFKTHLDFIKKIIEINNETKIGIGLMSHLDIDTFKYIFKDLQINKILSLTIHFPGLSSNSTELYDYLKGFVKDLDHYNYKKFTINAPPVNPIHGDLGY